MPMTPYFATDDDDLPVIDVDRQAGGAAAQWRAAMRIPSQEAEGKEDR